MKTDLLIQFLMGAAYGSAAYSAACLAISAPPCADARALPAAALSIAFTFLAIIERAMKDAEAGS